MKSGLLLLLLLCVAPVRADMEVSVCYNYGCNSEARVSFSTVQLEKIRDQFALAANPERERSILATAAGQLLAWAGQQSPIWRDRAGNYADDYVQGRMDCIDHSTTTTRLLHLIEENGWLRFHRVLPPVRRTSFVIGQHFSANIEEKISGLRYAVDSWFVEHGQPAVVMPLEEWLAGGGPNV